MAEHEWCQCCASATGKAGRSDGSLYVTTTHGEIGPLCNQCYEELQGQWFDTVFACLVAAGASENLDEQERQVKAVGAKPSDFIRAQCKLLDDVLALIVEWRDKGRSGFSLPVIRGELLAALEARIEGRG